MDEGFLKPSLLVRKKSNSLTAGHIIALLTSSTPLLLSVGLSVGYEVTHVLRLQELGCLGMFCNFGIAHRKELL